MNCFCLGGSAKLRGADGQGNRAEPTKAAWHRAAIMAETGGFGAVDDLRRILTSMRRGRADHGTRSAIIPWIDSIRPFYFAVQQLSALDAVMKSLTEELPVSLAKNVDFLRRLSKLNGFNGFGDWRSMLKPGRQPACRSHRFRRESRATQDVLLCARAICSAALLLSSFCMAAVRPPPATIWAPAGPRWRGIMDLRC